MGNLLSSLSKTIHASLALAIILFIGLFIGIVLLLLLDRILTYLPFDGYLGKLISLLVLVIIASKNTFLGIIKEVK